MSFVCIQAGCVYKQGGLMCRIWDWQTNSLHDLQGEGSTPTEIARNLQSSWSLQDLEVWKSKLNIRGEQEHPLKKNKFQLLLCFFGTPSFTSSSVYFDVVHWSLWWRQCVIALAGEPSPQWEAGVVSQWPGYDDVNGQDAIIPKSGYGHARRVHPLNREAIPKKMGLYTFFEICLMSHSSIPNPSSVFNTVIELRWILIGFLWLLFLVSISDHEFNTNEFLHNRKMHCIFHRRYE